jgi:Mg-chelatase subunit ChlD
MPRRPNITQNNDQERQSVLVNVILDKSGSMASKAVDVVEGFNAYIAGLLQEEQANYLFP